VNQLLTGLTKMAYLKNLKNGFLVTGASGFMGGNLAVYLSSYSPVTAQFNKNTIKYDRVIPLRIDFANENEIKHAITSNKFDWVIHCAAVTSPDACANDKQYSKKINIEGTRRLANYCSEKSVPIIYISTDLVFDGKKGNYEETDTPNPISFYGETKLQAEQVVLDGLDKNIVCRIALSYGKCFKNTQGGALDKMIASLNEDKALNLFTDQFRTPLFSGDFCNAIEKLMTAKAHNNPACRSRIYHLGGADKVSRLELGRKIVSVFGYKPELINPITMDQIKSAAKRGKDCSLNCTRAINEFNYKPLSIVENLHIDKKLREGS